MENCVQLDPVLVHRAKMEEKDSVDKMRVCDAIPRGDERSRCRKHRVSCPFLQWSQIVLTRFLCVGMPRSAHGTAEAPISLGIGMIITASNDTSLPCTSQQRHRRMTLVFSLGKAYNLNSCKNCGSELHQGHIKTSRNSRCTEQMELFSTVTGASSILVFASIRLSCHCRHLCRGAKCIDSTTESVFRLARHTELPAVERRTLTAQ